ncbi:MAG: ATP-dependent DNA helicase RecG [Anaerolineales bacterium]|nr:ATP-dependent DNA helicase RecG [Anaerolineales bacterium]
MNESLTKLSKFFKLEADRGYDNRAVVGGLKRMLDPWKEQAKQENVPEPIIQVVESRLRDYSRLAPLSRKEALQGLWNRLSENYPDLPKDLFSAEPSQESAADTPPTPARSGSAPPAAVEEPHPAAARPPVEQPDSGDKKPAKPAREPEKPESAGPPLALDAPLTTIQGVGPKTAKTLAKLGLSSLGDLLWHLPRRYDDYSQLETINRLWYGQEVTVIGTVESADLREVRGGRMKLTEATISDGTGSLRVTWFNQPWLLKKLKPGTPIVLSGKVDQYLGRLTMANPEWEPLEQRQLHTNRIVPVYPLTAGVNGKWLRRVISSVVERLAPRVPDPLPESVRASAQLTTLHNALKQAHFPDSWEALKEAQHRLAFDEMFMLQLGVLKQKKEWEQLQTRPLPVETNWMESFVRGLPYQLTPAQQRAVDDIRGDMASKTPMNRLLQGDVGSGKTVVAAVGMGIAAANQSQSALMAPTSILAEQHYRTLVGLLPAAAAIEPSRIRLLIGATPESEKEEIRQALEAGEIDVVVGTHALIEDPVRFKQLGYVIIDEQHRFGVEQRARLRDKGDNPNLLVMTATPIPRSLALTIYGDLELTVLDEMPPGRQVVETRVMFPRERNRAYTFIRGQLEQGHQAFVIFPLVEETEKLQTKAAVDEHAEIQDQIFPDYKVGLLHGRLKQEQKDDVMAQFRSGELDVLVSTSVVEVGVDIPNATVMLVEGANHFGLAQLHQFRGRVGRGSAQSYCILIPDEADDTQNERLRAMAATSDGFRLAEMDLDHRGPGDFLGKRQSGFAELRMAQLTDIRLIEKARKEAQRIFSMDPELHEPEHALIASELERLWTIEKGEIS